MVEECRITLDQRHLDAPALAAHAGRRARRRRPLRRAKATCASPGSACGRSSPFCSIPALIDFCDDAIRETCGKSHRLPSGPLHDAAEVARAGVPTVMMFVQSLHGISHNKIEDTREEHLELCVTAFDKLAEKTMQWMVK